MEPMQENIPEMMDGMATYLLIISGFRYSPSCALCSQ